MIKESCEAISELKALSEIENIAAHVNNKVSVIVKMVSMKAAEQVKLAKDGRIFKKQEC